MTKLFLPALGMIAALAICGCTQQAPAPSNPNVTTGQAPAATDADQTAANQQQSEVPQTTLVRLTVPGMT